MDKTTEQTEKGGTPIYAYKPGESAATQEPPRSKVDISSHSPQIPVANQLFQTKYAIFTDSDSLISALKEADWKDTHEWLRVIKSELGSLNKEVTICWVPSHCGTDGYERADQLASEGARLNQDQAPVTNSILKAKIRNKKWEIKHERAKRIFTHHRGPPLSERLWPLSVRRKYRRLRTGHDKELRRYRCKIEMDKYDTCQQCDAKKPEGIEHVTCECPSLEYWRQYYSENPITPNMLVDDSEICRSLLAKKYKDLKIPAGSSNSNLKDTLGKIEAERKQKGPGQERALAQQEGFKRERMEQEGIEQESMEQEQSEL